MASNAITIQQVLADAAGSLQAEDSGSKVVDQLQLLTDQLQNLQTVQQAAVEARLLQTQVVKTSATANTANTQVGGDSSGGTLLNVFGSGLGLSPLISGILKLFGGGDSPSAATPLVKFGLPPSVNLNTGIGEAFGGGAFGVDYGQGGGPRPVTAAIPQVTVQVNAMDSRSFLDHSNDIAMAVRQAMLESSILSDVVREA